MVLLTIGVCLAALKPLFFQILVQVWGAFDGISLTAITGCVGLRRKSVNFPDMQEVEPLIVAIFEAKRTPIFLDHGFQPL